MARVQKYTDAAVVNQIRHCKRETKHNSNTDIDSERTYLNYSLTPRRKISEYEYYKQRKAELYCYHRADVKTLASWVVTVPKDIEDSVQIHQFFKTTSDFLIQRYGLENVIAIECHFDEGKMEKMKDRWTGNYITDENGNVKQELVLGRPHLHFLFIPVAPDRNKKHFQTEKICANDVLTKTELKRFHSSLKKYLKSNHGPGADGIINGATKAQGRNYSVSEMKEYYDMKQELERLRNVELKYNMQVQRDRSSERIGRW